MRIAAGFVVAVALAGCASSPEYVAQQSNWDVCRLTMRGPHARAAEVEAQNRGLNCHQYYGAIESQLQRESAAIESYRRAINPPSRPMPMPQDTRCVSRRVGNQIYTDCN